MSEHIPAPLRREVYERAGGQCEYCLMPEIAVFAPHQIDHVVARKHGGQTKADNLALACSLCNKHKGTDLASIDSTSGEIVPLYNPRHHLWVDHFRLENGRIVPLTATGRVTVYLLQLNRAERVAEREILFATGEIHISD